MAQFSSLKKQLMEPLMLFTGAFLGLAGGGATTVCKVKPQAYGTLLENQTLFIENGEYQTAGPLTFTGGKTGISAFRSFTGIVSGGYRLAVHKRLRFGGELSCLLGPQRGTAFPVLRYEGTSFYYTLTEPNIATINALYPCSGLRLNATCTLAPLATFGVMLRSTLLSLKLGTSLTLVTLRPATLQEGQYVSSYDLPLHFPSPISVSQTFTDTPPSYKKHKTLCGIAFGVSAEAPLSKRLSGTLDTLWTCYTRQKAPIGSVAIASWTLSNAFVFLGVRYALH